MLITMATMRAMRLATRVMRRRRAGLVVVGQAWRVRGDSQVRSSMVVGEVLSLYVAVFSGCGCGV